jgi:hypothetical protein
VNVLSIAMFTGLPLAVPVTVVWLVPLKCSASVNWKSMSPWEPISNPLRHVDLFTVSADPFLDTLFSSIQKSNSGARFFSARAHSSESSSVTDQRRLQQISLIWC